MLNYNKDVLGGIYLRNFRDKLEEICDTPGDRRNIMQICFYGVKWALFGGYRDENLVTPAAFDEYMVQWETEGYELNLGDKSISEVLYQYNRETIESCIGLCDAVIAGISQLTPAELLNTFPVEKRFDGKRWGTKDYFVTMAELDKIGMDTVIGYDHVLDLLWDYANDDIRKFLVNYLRLMSAKRRQQGRLGIVEEFCIMNGIKTYTQHKDPDTGEVTFIDRKAYAETRRADTMKTFPWLITIPE